MITKINTYKLYQQYIISDFKLNEGLILTHDIYDSSKILKTKLEFNGDLEIKDNKINIYLDKFDFKFVIDYLTLINNLGYFISNLKLTNINNRTNKLTINKLIDNNQFNQIFFDNIKKIDLVLEPKFDNKHELKTNILYHVTEERFLDKILKNGLIPKQKNNQIYYPDRIYFTYNLDDSKEYINSKMFFYDLYPKDKKYQDLFKKTKFIILKIELPKDNNLIFYEDPNFKNKGIYTYENINPKYISIVK